MADFCYSSTNAGLFECIVGEPINVNVDNWSDDSFEATIESIDCEAGGGGTITVTRKDGITGEVTCEQAFVLNGPPCLRDDTDNTGASV